MISTPGQVSARRRFHYQTSFALSCAMLFASLASMSANWRDHYSQKGDSIWVTNRDQGTLAVFDASTGEALAPTPIFVGLGAHDLVVSRRTHRAFVVNETENTVSVLSAATLKLVATIPLGPRPHHVDLSPDGKTVWVGLFGANRIAAIDARTLDVREYTTSEEAGPLAHAPKPSPDGRYVFVPHEIGNLITKLSIRTGTIRRSISPGDTSSGQPSEVLTTRDGRILFASMRNEGKVKTIDGNRFTVTGEVSVGTQPESLVLTPDERTLVVSLRGTPAQLAFVNVEERRLVHTVRIGEEGTFGDLAVRSPDGRYVYATFDAGITGQGGIARVDVKRRTVTRWWFPGVGRPHGIDYATVNLRLR
jgi:YVTN family beta-propeller protein